MKSRILLLFACLSLWGTGTIDGAEPHAFGWIGDDGSKPARMMALRDWPIQTPAAQSDLTKYAPPVLDQGHIGSCVGHGTALAWTMQHYRASGEHFPISRLLIYYNARAMEGWENADTGCQIVDAVNSLIKLGSCDEKFWPYQVNRFRQKPCPCVYAEALNHRVIRAYKVDNTDGKSIRLALTNQWPVVFGSMVYSGIDRVTAAEPVIPLPRRGERPRGGHCMTLIGHDDARQLYRLQNSWGTSWGDSGRAWIPYAYIHNGRLTEDCWVIEEVMQSAGTSPDSALRSKFHNERIGWGVARAISTVSTFSVLDKATLHRVYPNAPP